MLDDSPVVRGLKFGGLGLLAGVLTVADPFGLMRVFGFTLPGIVLGVIVAAYLSRLELIHGWRSLAIVGCMAVSAQAAVLAAFGFQLFVYGFFFPLPTTPAVPDSPTIPTMIFAGMFGAAGVAASVLPWVAATRSMRRILVCSAAGAVMGGIGYSLCLAGDFRMWDQDQKWPGLVPLFVVWPAGVAAALGWVLEEPSEI